MDIKTLSPGVLECHRVDQPAVWRFHHALLLLPPLLHLMIAVPYLDGCPVDPYLCSSHVEALAREADAFVLSAETPRMPISLLAPHSVAFAGFAPRKTARNSNPAPRTLQVDIG